MQPIRKLEDYADILNEKAPVSGKHPLMSREKRAAQFLPFSALTGFESVIAETARATEKHRELTQEEKEALGRKLSRLIRGQKVAVTYFEKDPHKEGGAACLYRGVVHAVDDVSQTIQFESGKRIRFLDLYSLETIKL